MNYIPPDKRPGLQAQRTELSWTRTSLAFAANGFLLLLRGEVPGPIELHYGAAGISILLLGFTLTMSHRRRRVLRRKSLSGSLAAPIPVILLGCGTLLLGSIFLLLLILE